MYHNRKCKITFISNGATIYSEDGRFSDSKNYPPLSDLGIEETSNVIKYIKARGVKNDVIYTSPSVRTVQTAMMIAKSLKKDYVILDDLTTRSYGVWNGKTYAEMLEKHSDVLSDILVNLDYNIDGVESLRDFIHKISNVIGDVVKENIGNRIIIVTHPEVIQACICCALEIPADKIHKIFIRTGSLTQISYYENWASLVYSDYVPL